MSTAVYLKSESADSYLYCFDENLSDSDAWAKALEQCPEDEEYIIDYMIERTGDPE